MASFPFDLLPGETLIDTRTLLYISPAGGKYNGRCTITNQRLFYDALLDYSAGSIASSFLIIHFGSMGKLMIPKSSIKDVEQKKSFLDKRVLTLDKGEKHTFSYGAMNIDKEVAAIIAR